MAHLVGYRMSQDLRMGSDTLFRILCNARIVNSGVDPVLTQSNTQRTFREVRRQFRIDSDRKPAWGTWLNAYRIGCSFGNRQRAVEPRNCNARLAEDPSGLIFCHR